MIEGRKKTRPKRRPVPRWLRDSPARAWQQRREYRRRKTTSRLSRWLSGNVRWFRQFNTKIEYIPP